MRSPVDPEAAVEYGLFSRRQARNAGYRDAEIDLKLRRGQWASCGRGVLRVVHRDEQRGDALLLAVLRAGPRAVASHLSAAAALEWELLDDPKLPEIIVPRNQRTAASPGARLRRQHLDPSEITHVGVLPVTGPARTAVDVAATADSAAATVAIDSALRLRHVTVDELQAELRTRRRMRASPAVSSVLDLVDPTSGSVPETVARLLFRSAGLPMPCPQFEIHLPDGRIARVDFAWPQFLLVVEIDGLAWHSGSDAMQRDLTRQNLLMLAGYRVLRFTVDDVRNQPQAVVDVVRQALGC